MNKENMNLAFSVIIFALLIRNLSLMKQVDNLEKGIKKGDQLYIPVDQIDYNIHNLSDPVKEDTITVYSKIEDKDKGIMIDQGLRVKEKDFDPKFSIDQIVFEEK